MKLLYLVFALLVSVAGVAQSVPPKGATSIIVTLPDSGEVAWQKAAQVLLARGYTFKNQDKTLLSFNTEQRAVNKGTTTSIAGFVKGNQLTLRGTYAIAALKDEPLPISLRGMKGSPTLVAWGELDAAAKAMGGTVSYQK